MDVLQTQTQLKEPVEDLTLRETLVAQFRFFYTTLEVSSFTIIHHDAHVVFLYEAIVVPHDIRVV